LEETPEPVLLWIDYVESTLQAIEIQDWIDELGKNKTVVALFTGTELYFQHLLDLSRVQGVARILKAEHMGYSSPLLDWHHSHSSPTNG
jgi:hypothetical protein